MSSPAANPIRIGTGEVHLTYDHFDKGLGWNYLLGKHLQISPTADLAREYVP